MTASGYRAEPAALTAAADGIEAVVGELAPLTTAGRASAGRGVSELELDAAQFGHDGLGEVFSTFCRRWEWGVRGLAQDGSAMAEGLRESGRAYEQADQATGSALSRLISVAAGDPRAGPEQAVRQSPEDIARSAAPEGPDAWSRAGESMARTWSDVGRDVVDTGTDRISRALDGQNPYGAEVDSLHEIVE